MLTLKKMMSIIREKDPEKQAALLDALSDKDKAKLMQTAEELHKEGKELARIGQKMRERK